MPSEILAKRYILFSTVKSALLLLSYKKKKQEQHISVALSSLLPPTLLESNAFSDWVGRSDRKKKTSKKNYKKSCNRRPWYLRTTSHFGLTKYTISMLLLYSFFRLKQFFQVKNGLTTSSLFLLKLPKSWVGTPFDEKRLGSVVSTRAQLQNGAKNFPKLVCKFPFF